MKLAQIISSAVLASVPAFVASCGPDCSTPEGLVRAQVELLQELAQVSRDFKKEELPAFVDTLQDLTRRQRKLAAAADAMDPEERRRTLDFSTKYKDEVQKAGSESGAALAKINKEVGIGNHKSLEKALDSFWAAWRQTQENLVGRYR